MAADQRPVHALPPHAIGHVVVRGATLPLIDHGAGTPVALVHGTLGGLHDWLAHLPALAARHRVLAWSRRHHAPGATPADAVHYTMAEQSQDIGALLVQRGATPAAIVGHSYGAYVALHLALAAPPLVRALVLCEPPVLPWLAMMPDGHDDWAAFERNALQPAALAFARGDAASGVARFMEGITGRPFALARLAPAVRDALMAQAPALHAELATPRGDYMPTLDAAAVARLEIPILLVRGGRSPRPFQLLMDRLQALLPGADTVTIAGRGHDMIGDVSGFDDAVLAFLSRRDVT
ncbi:MAG: alpha/beta hydrolase [Gemmatimonadaceae bacterium]|jgi:pimeloyl-ACP methyl ester carboxylesterase|nr:alpha/beta hydrolase [Gemmatimonadaceae bacterium]